MKKNSKKNQKGSVLFTVICFTTVLMILTTTALSVSSYANKVSTTNVKSTQAQITAQNCLDSYLETFLDASTGKYDYSEIANIADNDDGGHYEASPYEFTVSMSGGSANVGDCKIQIFKSSSSGYVVKCETTYGGKTESASAFFDGKVVKNYQSENAVETIGGINKYINSSTNGDVLVESNSVYDTVAGGIGGQSKINGNLTARCNLIFGAKQTLDISDTADGKAPTLKTLGYLFYADGSVKTDASKPTSSRVYKSKDANGSYTNDDGYVYTDKKIIFRRKDHTAIGNVDDPVDVYCHGAYFGVVPNFAPDYSDIKTIIDVANKSDGLNAGYVSDDTVLGVGSRDANVQINGNVYSYYSNAKQNGDVYFALQNGNTINGDLVVQGDIYLVEKYTFDVNVTGTIYCTGSIKRVDANGNVLESKSVAELENDGATEFGVSQKKIKANGKFKNTLPSDLRSQMPNLTFDSATTQYTVATPNDMFIDNNADSNFLANRYTNAYNKVDDTNWTKFVYTDSACTQSIYDLKASITDNNVLMNKLRPGSLGGKVYIKDDLNLSLIVSKWTTVFPDGIDKYTFNVVMPITEDRYVLLPSDCKNMNIFVDYTASSKIENSVPVNFCYFMLECGAYGSYYTTKSPTTSTWTMSKTSIWDNRSPMSGYTSTKYKVNNNFILVPDNCTFNMSLTDNYGVKAVIYGPGSDFNLQGSGGSKKLYGQAIVKTYNPTLNGATIDSCLPSPGSILKYIDSKSPSDGAVQFQYYIKHKS